MFHDRLIDEDDRIKLFGLIKTACYQNFRQPMDKVCSILVGENETLGPSHVRNLFFGNYIEPDADPKLYDEVFIFRGKMKKDFDYFFKGFRFR